MLLATIHNLFRNTAKQMNVEEQVMLAKQGEEAVLHELLLSHTAFMKKTASYVCKRYIREADDEYSIAMSAFHDAIISYETDKNASFLTFAHLLIRRKLIDHIRKEARRIDQPVGNSLLIDEEANDAFTHLESSHAFEQFTAEQQQQERLRQIIQFEEMLQPYQLSFSQLAEVAPSHEDARRTAFQIAQIVAETDEFFDTLQTKKRLPLKELEELVSVSRKTLERQRKYIIAIALLLNSELHYLIDYLKGRM
ncbi:RNA polymerase sigma-I factor [Paenisporosarcina cavernae]|uniref:RNA polymerase sigma factor SigI n=1 Tax=Paenisporosarcina cavernae TaxID=2320858 RepID=A0A385YQM5_9BACL|nr:RNA polymerase sigma-I factor [Paenisporosarcina cavernae]AYC29055.1 RNA polymerase sigma-I factor [Paenisporosarcina cavernae]